jgi:type I restriction enzyme S subunit
VLRDKSKKTTENYRQYIFQNEEVRNRLRKIANGVSVYGISKSNLSKMQINLPSIPEQIIIANILTTSDKEITELEKKLSIIKEQKRYLLNNLITGTIRTPETLSTK